MVISDEALQTLGPGPLAAFASKWLMQPYYARLGWGITGAPQPIVARIRDL